jgi:Uncharacterized conserved protein (DUF2183)
LTEASSHRLIKSLAAVSFILFSSVSNADDKPIVLSGFDDVLRQAENTGVIKTALKIFEDDTTFSGMPELYTRISQERASPKFFLVSAISAWFDGRIDRFLTTSKFPSNRRYLRNWLTQWSIEDFKVEKIKEILSENSNQKFIVIFDNSDASISLAQTLDKKFPDQIEAVYLRQVVKKDIPKNSFGFYTAFDIALHEYANHRLNLSETRIVGQAIFNEDKVERLFPSYAICPGNYDPCKGAASEIIEFCYQISQHVQSLCNK